MALTLGDNFSYQGAKPLDARLKYSTVAEMKAVGDSTMYDGCLAYCSATEKTYQWKSTNSVDETLGRWREFSSGGGGGGTNDYVDLDNKPSVNNVELNGNKTSSDLGLASKEDMDKAYKSDDTVLTDIADGDYIPIYDTSATAKKKSLWSNIKSKLKTYFDTLYDLNKSDIPFYATSSTGASTTAKTATVSRGTFGLVAGAKVSVRFTNTNTASAPTLNVGSTGAKNIKYIDSDGTVTTPTTWWGAGEVVTFVYDGTQWLMMPTISMIPSLPVVGTINRSDIYDTTEKVIGKWTDGRPLYQKTFVGTSNSSGNITSVGTISNARIYNIQGVISNTSTTMANSTTSINIPVGATSTSGSALDVSIFAYFDTSTINLTVADSANTYRNKGYAITVQYTKTTDSANSYNYANENDYSTSEKIVGKWIDGSYLYQKTITATLTNTSASGVLTQQYININATTKDIVNCDVRIRNSNNNSDMILPMITNQSSTLMYLYYIGFSNNASSNKNTIRIDNAWVSSGSHTVYVTVQYTKP